MNIETCEINTKQARKTCGIVPILGLATALSLLTTLVIISYLAQEKALANLARSSSLPLGILLISIVIPFATSAILLFRIRRQRLINTAMSRRSHAVSQEKACLGQQLQQTRGTGQRQQQDGGIRHHLNNLFASILNNTEMLVNSDSLTIRDHICAENIIDAVKRASDLSNSFADAAQKRESSSERLIRFHDFLLETIAHTSTSLGRRNDIVHSFHAGTPIVNGDERALNHLFSSLILNLSNTLPVNGRVILETSVRHIDRADSDLEPGTYVVTKVSGDGHCTFSQHQDWLAGPRCVFENTEDNVGMGLASAHALIKLHHGRLEVKDTEIIVLLPMIEQNSLSAASAQVEEANNNTKKSKTEEESPRILIVDDEDFLRDAIQRALSVLGYRVTGFSDGFRAVNHYQKHHDEIDIVILDVVMPGMSGPKLLGKIKDITPDKPVIMITGFPGDVKREDLIAKGANELMLKPFHIREIDNVIKGIL